MRSWSIAPTLGWFAFLTLGTIWALDGNLASVTGLVDQPPGETGDEATPPRPPGPAFVGGGGGGGGGGGDGDGTPPPLPMPRAAGQDSAYTGQTIEDACLKKSGSACAEWAMDPFYRALAGVERADKGALARVSHYGDSVVADDYIASRARERLQTNYGDGGAGFVFLASPNRWYIRGGVVQSASGWTVKSITGTQASDALYGLGGTVFEAGSGAKAKISTTKKGTLGDKASRFEFYYLNHPKGGKFQLDLDAGSATIDTKDATTHTGYVTLTVADGAQTLKIKTTAGRVRAYGVVMEREGPGVVYENMGVVSGSAKAFSWIDADHWREQLAHRRADLIIMMLGANEAEWVGTSAKAMGDYQALYEKILAQIRKARPDGACLVMAPLDAAEAVGGKLVSKKVIGLMVDAQRQAATNQGCAFWDTYAWMGGKGSAAKFGKKGYLASDYTHPTKKGGAVIADGFVDALIAGLDAYKARGGK